VKGLAKSNGANRKSVKGLAKSNGANRPW